MFLNNSIVITNNKNQLLKSINKLINIKFMTINEYIKSYYFDYDYKAIIYLMNKYDFKYEIALEYLNNLIYVEDKFYNNSKLDFLVKIKNELTDNNLLIFDNTFKDYLNSKKIYVYNYNLSKFEKHLLKDGEEVKLKQNNYTPKIYEFETIKEEVEYIAYEISSLINQGVDISKIKLTNVSNDYINIITNIFNLYNLKINKFHNIPIISTVIGNIFYSNLTSIEAAIQSISSYKNTDIYNQIIDICNKYILCDFEDFKLLVSYDLKNTYIKNKKYTNMIEVVDYRNHIFTDEYVFMINFNQGVIPKIYKDEDYINDSIKPIYMDNTIEKNIKEKELVLNIIRNIPNLIITYKLKTDFNTFYPSSLIEKLGEVTRPSLDYQISYSELMNQIKFAKSLDEYYKYGTYNSLLEIFYSNYEKKYNTYNNNFTGISKEKIKKYISNLDEFNLSYSSIDNFNRCSFRFYLSKILNIRYYEESFNTILGNIYHEILKQDNLNIKEEVYKYINDNNIKLTNSNKFFVDLSISNIKYLLNVIEKQNSYSKLAKSSKELRIQVPILDNINFIGFIDKINYNTINEELIASIIDYKTYIKKPSLKYINNGIDLQLPFYMYLASNYYKNIKFAGFYLQNIILDNKAIEEKEKSLKLIGYTNKDKEILKHFDYNYFDSKVIDGLKTNKDGNFSNSSLKRMLSDEQINIIIEKTEEIIKKVVNEILEAHFDINPKYDKGNIGCEFCNYKDICHMNESNFVYIKPKLEGEDDE